MQTTDAIPADDTPQNGAVRESSGAGDGAPLNVPTLALDTMRDGAQTRPDGQDLNE